MKNIKKHHFSLTIAAGAVIAVSSLIAYIPALQAGFVWDDDVYVTNNPLLSAEDGLSRIWFSKDSPSQYFPMVYTTFRLEYALWGLDAHGYHMTNVLLHIINSLLLWRLLQRLDVKWSWLAAIIFAIHPVNVESVAWITERKNVLVVFFSLLSLLAWMRFADHSSRSEPAGRFYFFSMILYLLALFSKTTACTLPAALLLLLWIKHIRVDLKRCFQILPFIIFGIAMGLLTVWWEQQHQGTGQMGIDLSFIERILVASHALWFYLAKLLFPVSLAFSYPQWDINASDPWQYGWLIACLISAWAIWHWRAKINRSAIAAVLFFAATLFPMLGFFSLYTFRYTYVADHYQYFAGIGPIAIFVALANTCAAKFTDAGKYVVTIAAVCILCILGMLTWKQCAVYTDLKTLWTDTINKNPDSWMAHNNLGMVLQIEGKTLQAETHYRQAVRIEPEFAETYYNWGTLFLSQRKVDEAIGMYQRALEIKPDYAKCHLNWANALLLKNAFDDAIEHYQQTLQIAPDTAKAYDGWANALTAQGRLSDALDRYRQAIKLDPRLANAHSNLAATLERLGRFNEALEHYTEALRLNPGHLQAQAGLKRTQKRFPEKGR